MWQKELKQLKKVLPKQDVNTSVKTVQPLKEEPKPISFIEYCNELNIVPFSQDAVILKKTSSPRINHELSSASRQVEDSFEFLDITNAPKEFFRFGQRLLPKQLRENKTQISRTIDMHNLTRTHAINLIESLLDTIESGLIIKIIHGMGNNSDFNQPVLMGTIRKYLMQSPRVLAFSYGNINQGGNGVTIVKLAK